MQGDNLCFEVENLVEALGHNKIEHSFSLFHHQSLHSSQHWQVQPYKQPQNANSKTPVSRHTEGERGILIMRRLLKF
jgi:hypothetical protein